MPCSLASKVTSSTSSLSSPFNRIWSNKNPILREAHNCGMKSYSSLSLLTLGFIANDFFSPLTVPLNVIFLLPLPVYLTNTVILEPLKRSGRFFGYYWNIFIPLPKVRERFVNTGDCTLS